MQPTVRNERELNRFAITITLIALSLALTADIVNQLTYFIDWPTCLRSWAITTTIVVGVALPVSRAVGKTHVELYAAKLHAEAMSLTDPLTGLPNRRALMEAFATATPDLLALVIYDIDRFKRINDTYGHLAGDAVLRAIGQMMAAEFGPFGCVARIGGEEFALLSSGVPLEALANELIAFCERVGATPILINGQSMRVTISAGVALWEQGHTVDDLYALADRALYAAKRSGRNRVQFPPAFDALLQKIGAKYGTPEPEPLARSA
jgi:diguanylate cyclase (GGDEF)-like protein